MDYVDLHCHVLPALDDGPASFADSIALLEASWQAGTRRLVATPHMFQAGLGSDDPSAVAGAFAEFERRLQAHRQAAGPSYLAGLELALGAENFVGEPFLRALEGRQVLTLGGSRYLLIEFWPMITALAAGQAIDTLQDRGYVPVLAHVERYGFLQNDPARLEQLVRGAGCVAQVNATAVLGRQGLRLAQLTDRWLRQGWIGVVASDGHGAATRPAELAPVAAHLEARYGTATVDACLRDNPAAILADAATNLPPPKKPARWWRR